MKTNERFIEILSDFLDVAVAHFKNLEIKYQNNPNNPDLKKSYETLKLVIICVSKNLYKLQGVDIPSKSLRRFTKEDFERNCFIGDTIIAKMNKSFTEQVQAIVDECFDCTGLIPLEITHIKPYRLVFEFAAKVIQEYSQVNKQLKQVTEPSVIVQLQKECDSLAELFTFLNTQLLHDEMNTKMLLQLAKMIPLDASSFRVETTDESFSMEIGPLSVIRGNTNDENSNDKQEV